MELLAGLEFEDDREPLVARLMVRLKLSLLEALKSPLLLTPRPPRCPFVKTISRPLP